MPTRYPTPLSPNGEGRHVTRLKVIAWGICSRMSSPREEKAEADTDADPKVAGSRASEGDDDPSDGPYVGRSSSDDDFDAGESGAEARSDD